MNDHSENNLFDKLQEVVHVKTGNVYMIYKTPHNIARLEYNNETYYQYKGKDDIWWIRCKSEMEDGRFVVKRVDNNWPILLEESAEFIGNKYTHRGKEYTFFGLVHGNDDYYYGMCDSNSKVLLLSCVGNLESFDFVSV